MSKRLVFSYGDNSPALAEALLKMSDIITIIDVEDALATSLIKTITDAIQAAVAPADIQSNTPSS